MRVIVSLSALVLGLLGPVRSAQAQEQDWGVWSAFAGQGHFDQQSEQGRWRWWFDSHARFFHDSNGFEQSIVRPGLGYDVSKESTLWFGYAWIRTDPEAAPSLDEHRVWQQLTWGRTVDQNTFYSRTRLEQRLLETGDDVGWRFRQFLRMTRPFGPTSKHGLRFWDELFFDLNDTDWGADTGFSQNRLFAGLGWTIDQKKHFTLEYGYLNQFIPRSGADDSMNHILSIQLLLNL